MLSYPYGWITAASLFFLLILAGVIASPVVITSRMNRSGDDDNIEVDVKAILGLFRYQVHVPTIDFRGLSLHFHEKSEGSRPGMTSTDEMDDEINTDKIAKAIDKMKDIVHMTNNLKGWARQTLTRVRLTEWKWSTSVGTGDAMWTAMTTGFIWSIKTTMIGVISQMVKLRAEPRLVVSPVYQKACFTTEWSCIAQIPFGYAILAGLQLLVRIRKEKGGVKAWQNILFKA